MPLIKSGNWRAGEECQRMKLVEGFRDLVVLGIDLADSVISHTQIHISAVKLRSVQRLLTVRCLQQLDQVICRVLP